VTLVLFMTAPVSAHLLAKAALHLGLESQAPPPVQDTDLPPGPG
jgi:multicomponent K+:H+ antiporter subunit G